MFNENHRNSGRDRPFQRGHLLEDPGLATQILNLLLWNVWGINLEHYGMFVSPETVIFIAPDMNLHYVFSLQIVTYRHTPTTSTASYRANAEQSLFRSPTIRGGRTPVAMAPQ